MSIENKVPVPNKSQKNTVEGGGSSLVNTCLAHAVIVDKKNNNIGFYVTDKCFAKKHPEDDYWGMYYSHKAVKYTDGLQMFHDGLIKNLSMEHDMPIAKKPLIGEKLGGLPYVLNSVIMGVRKEPHMLFVVPMNVRYEDKTITPEAVKISVEYLEKLQEVTNPTSKVLRDIADAYDSSEANTVGTDDFSVMLRGIEEASKAGVCMDLMLLSGSLSKNTTALGIDARTREDVLGKMKAAELTRLEQLLGQDTLLLPNMSFSWFKEFMENKYITVTFDPSTLMKQYDAVKSTPVDGGTKSEESKQLVLDWYFQAVKNCNTINQHTLSSVKSGIEGAKSENLGPNCQAYIKKFNMTPDQFYKDSQRLMYTFQVNTMVDLEREIVALI